jgi:hypothetical protein
MTIHLFNHRGDHIAETFDATLPHLPRVGDFIRRQHPGFNGEIRTWHVISVLHDLTTPENIPHVIAWETKDDTINAELRERHDAHLYISKAPK